MFFPFFDKYFVVAAVSFARMPLLPRDPPCSSSSSFSSFSSSTRFLRVCLSSSRCLGVVLHSTFSLYSQLVLSASILLLLLTLSNQPSTTKVTLPPHTASDVGISGDTVVGSALSSSSSSSLTSSSSWRPILPFVLYSNGLFYESAPNARDCFYLYAEENQGVNGSFETFYGVDALRVTIEFVSDEVASPDGGGRKSQELFHSVNEADHFTISAPQNGRYALCLRNLLSNEQTVTFNIRVQPSLHATHPQDLATVDQTEALKELCEMMSGKMNDMAAQQSHAITRGAVHFRTTETANSRVLWWTIVKVCAIGLAAFLQIWYMRSFFEIKTIV